MKIGDMVKVLEVVDALDLRDYGSQGDLINAEKFEGRVGRIVKIELGAAGVGDSADDAFYTVEVPGLGRDGFWSEEL